MSPTPVADQVNILIKDHFSPSHLELIDDSHKHSGHSGSRAAGETHFRLMIVSGQFSGKSKVARHQEVYRVLKPLLSSDIHALQLFTYAPEEYTGQTSP